MFRKLLSGKCKTQPKVGFRVIGYPNNNNLRTLRYLAKLQQVQSGKRVDFPLEVSV